MLESGVEDEHIALINNQMEFGSTIGMLPQLIPYTKWTFLPIAWLQSLQAGRERLKEVSLLSVMRYVLLTRLYSSLDVVLSDERKKRVIGKIFLEDSLKRKIL